MKQSLIIVAIVLRLVQTVQRYMLRPSEMAEALLNTQADCSDDVTVITKLV